MSENQLSRFKSLWKKESNDKNALYVDISGDPENFPLETFYEVNQESKKPATKNNGLSLKFRKKGNVAFGQKNFHFAIELYNQSLCLSETGSDNISLAFGNRSACFFSLKMFSKCLIDIDLAIMANFPERLIEKLEIRRKDCLKFIEDGIQFVPFQPVLSYEPKETFPSMANILQIEQNSEFGRYIKTNSNIEVGETLLVEKAYVKKVITDRYIRCNVCYRIETNLVPCKECTSDMFCHKECEYSGLHQIECNMKTTGCDEISSFHLQIVRSLLIAIKTIPNIEKLIAFVEETIASDPMEIPESEPSEDVSKYRMFLKLWINSKNETNIQFNWRVYFIYRTLMDNAEFKAIFTTLKYQRFLMHLIGHHSGIIHYNARASIQVFGTTYTTELQPLIISYFNHSCAPNIATVSCDDVLIAIAIRPIKKDEQLFISYFGRDLNRDTAGRRRHFDGFFDFVCKCERCTSTLPFVPFTDTYNLEWIQYIIINYYNQKFDFGDQSKVKYVMEKCVEYAIDNGHNFWTDEVSLVMNCFIHMLDHKLKYKLTF